MVDPYVVNLSDVPNQFKHLYMGYEAVKNSDKPVLGWGGMNKKTVKEFLDLIEISMGYAPETSGNPDMMLVNSPLPAMGHEMYNMPTRCMVGMCDSKVVDAQAGLETMQNVMMGVFTGADIIPECLGVLDSIMTVSYEKHIIDEEIIKRVMFICDGIDTSDDAMSVELIQDVGPGGNDLMEDDTFDYCHEPFQNTVSYCDGYAEWVADGSMDVAQRANRTFKERLANVPETFLTPDIDKGVKACMNKCMGI